MCKSLGQKAVAYTLQRKGINIVAAVDPDPKKVGQDLGKLSGVGSLGVTIEKTLSIALAGKRADAAIVTTLSSLERIETQLIELAEAELNMVSTCEELSCQWETKPDVAARIDEVCKKK